MTADGTETIAPRSEDRAAPLNQPTILSHGTITCRDMAVSRRFYEEFLGLDCVRIAKGGLLLRKGGYCGIVCLEVGDHVKPVDRQHQKEHYGIQRISRIATHHGTYSFYFQDLDGNFWEFQYAGGNALTGSGQYDQFFARGDVSGE
jgi:catechol-2,3-dioxygenase